MSSSDAVLPRTPSSNSPNTPLSNGNTVSSSLSNPTPTRPAQMPSHSPSSPPYPASPPSRPSMVPPYLSRLTRLLTLLLALGGSAALISTYLILPLLQSTFAARTALIRAQSDRMAGMLERLRAMRALGMYGPRQPQGADGGGEKDVIKEETASRSSRSSEAEGSAGADAEDTALLDRAAASDPKSDPPAPLLPLTPLSSLIMILRALAHARGNTSTTRTSLLSTIEAYTSSLHRQLWNPAPGHSAYGFGRGMGGGVGLGSLDQQLAMTGKGKSKTNGNGNGFGYGGSAWSDEPKGVTLEDVSDRREEWDAVRREIRGVKGLLLGRRTFARPT